MRTSLSSWLRLRWPAGRTRSPPRKPRRSRPPCRLHRGALVEECDDEWVIADRYRLENLYLTALDHLVQHHGGRGRSTPSPGTARWHSSTSRSARTSTAT